MAEKVKGKPDGCPWRDWTGLADAWVPFRFALQAMTMPARGMPLGMVGVHAPDRIRVPIYHTLPDDI